MSSLQSFQKYPDFYDSLNAASQKHPLIQTNPRYKGFNQTHFTAGDEEQFESYRHDYDGGQLVTHIENAKYWNKYNCLNHCDITNTFKYLFHKFKKGVFVKIKDGKLDVFLPFSKSKFVNEWSHLIDTSRFIEMASDICKKEGYRFNPKRVNGNTDEWYANGGLVRYEFPVHEGDSNISNLKNMLEEVCQNSSIPDVEFFVNRRDFPLLKKDGSEPYDQIWNSSSHPLVSHKYPKYAPVLSMVTNDNFADVAIPNHNDWARVMSKEQKWFPKSVGDFKDDFDQTNWENKIPTAVFRGASTGLGVTIETNPRLKIAHLSKKAVVNKRTGDIDLLDAGITSWNLRPRKLSGCDNLQTINTKTLDFNLVEFMSPQEQSKYKYIVHVEGHVESFRLSLELAMNCVVLMVKSKWKIWYSDKLIPWVHYVPVKEDLSDIFEQILWCRKNDFKCKEIAVNARRFFDDNLSKKSIISNMTTILTDLSGVCAIPPYPKVKHLDKMLEIENNWVNKKLKESVRQTLENLTNIYVSSLSSRCCKLVEVSNMILDQRYLCDSTTVIIFSNKLSKVENINVEGTQVVRKSTSDNLKIKEHKHEVFVGLTSTNRLLREIPNFSHVFGCYENNDGFHVLTEYIKGPTLYDYLNSEDFDIKVFNDIISQISLSLQIAQRECGFVHWDLTPWNIVIEEQEKHISIDYKINSTKVVTIHTKFVAIMIDYGRSQVFHNKFNHGFVNHNDMSTVQDIVTFILTCSKILLKKRVSNEVFRFILSLSNFMADTTYLQTPFKNAKSIKTFIRQHGNYADITTCDKGTLEQKTPYDLYKYITRTFS